MPLRTRRNRQQTTHRIIEALEAEIVERGVEGVGVNRIAQKANVSTRGQKGAGRCQTNTDPLSENAVPSLIDQMGYPLPH